MVDDYRADRRRRASAPRQHPQEGGRTRARHVDRRGRGAAADPRPFRARRAARVLSADGRRVRPVRVLRDRQGRLYRAAVRDHDGDRRRARRQRDRRRPVARGERADRHRDRARVFIRAAALCDLFVALQARRRAARLRGRARAARRRPPRQRRRASEGNGRPQRAARAAALADAVRVEGVRDSRRASRGDPAQPAALHRLSRDPVERIARARRRRGPRIHARLDEGAAPAHPRHADRREPRTEVRHAEPAVAAAAAGTPPDAPPPQLSGYVSITAMLAAEVDQLREKLLDTAQAWNI
ncbi:hypothetical protein FEP01_03117 [Burkholderia multivorans]|nr:hypothetical protein [Burkholderia multivorans]